MTLFFHARVTLFLNLTKLLNEFHLIMRLKRSGINENLALNQQLKRREVLEDAGLDPDDFDF